MYDERNRLEREIIKNERDVTETKEELGEMRALKQFMMRKIGHMKSEAMWSDAGIRQQAAAAAISGIADLDEVSRDVLRKRQHLSPLRPLMNRQRSHRGIIHHRWRRPRQCPMHRLTAQRLQE